MKRVHAKAENKVPRDFACGFVLLEVLVSILLFALGIVALVGLQARALVTTNDVQYRAEAVHLANSYVGKMWASGLTGVNLKAAYESGGGAHGFFSTQVTGRIPGAIAPVVNIVRNPQTITALGTVLDDNVDVTVSISWQDINTGVLHNYTLDTSIGF